ncbi:MAG: SDR family oxidoreductase [Candidatus Thiodiazotropha sp. LLP2]
MQDKTNRKAILLTGATGALGTELLPRLLQEYPQMDVIAIVRSNSQQEAKERLQQTLDDPELMATLDHRIQIVPGDVGKPMLGLDEALARQLIPKIEKIFHLAANVRFSASLAESRAGNVDTAHAVIDFSRQCMKANPQQFELHYVSTAYVVGDRQGPLGEDELNCGQGFWNAYEQSKLEAEQLAINARQEMPVTIYRPSQVICLSADGRVRKLFGFLEFMKLACSGRTSISVLPARADVKSDMVPIDYVCDAIAYLSGEPDTQNQTFHLAAGVSRSLRLDQVIDIAYQVIRNHAPDIDGIKKPSFLPTEVFEQQVKGGHVHQALNGLLGIYQTYLSYDRDFQVEETMRRLAKGGISLSPMAEVIERSIKYVVEQHFDAKAIQRMYAPKPEQNKTLKEQKGQVETVK